MAEGLTLRHPGLSPSHGGCDCSSKAVPCLGKAAEGWAAAQAAGRGRLLSRPGTASAAGDVGHLCTPAVRRWRLPGTLTHRRLGAGVLPEHRERQPSLLYHAAAPALQRDPLSGCPAATYCVYLQLLYIDIIHTYLIYILILYTIFIFPYIHIIHAVDIVNKCVYTYS